MSSERRAIRVGPLEPVITDEILLERGGRIDFFDGELGFLGSSRVPAEGGMTTALPGSSWWRVVREVAQ